jgi:hypothetical protein
MRVNVENIDNNERGQNGTQNFAGVGIDEAANTKEFASKRVSIPGTSSIRIEL